MLEKTPLEAALERKASGEEINTCDECEYIQVVGRSIYCGVSGKLLLPLMFRHGEGSGPARRCKKRKEAIRMGLTMADLQRLGAPARKQIMDKLNEQARQQLAAEKKAKYHNVRDERTASGGKIKFASRKEAARYDELLLLLKAGEIRNLKLQPTFTLQESYVTPDGERVRAITYVADFSYERRVRGDDQEAQHNPPYWNIEAGDLWVPFIEDVKSSGTRTEKYKIKRKMMLEQGHPITEV